MADLTRLANGLRSYQAELERHEAEVRAAFETLRRSLERLSSVYEGTGATTFKSHWAASARGLDEYLTGVRSIQGILDERIDHLSSADRSEGL